MEVTPRSLLIGAAVEACVALICVIAVMVHAVWQRRGDALRARRLHAARVLINQCLMEGIITDGDRAELRKMPMRARVTVLTAFATTFQGEERLLLHQLATLGGVTRLAERRCRSQWWSRRLQGARLFAIVGGGQHVVPGLFDDKNEEVRAGAAEWAAGQPEPEIIERLLPHLTDSSVFCRFVVKDSFLNIGPAATDALLAHLEADSAPSADVLDVARWVADARFMSVALRLVDSRDPLLRMHAMSLLATIGGALALDRLGAKLQDPDTGVRLSALRGLQRLGDWRAGALCMEALRDPLWDIRHEAARALLAMGAPGVVLLRKATRSDDRFAADMALYMLDMPAGVMAGAA
jgi:hypothetical protein